MRQSLHYGEIALATKTVPVKLSVDQAVPLGLIANELVTNAFKHCSDGRATISIELSRNASELTLTVSDTGVGMSADYDRSAHRGLGMKVIELLTRQLKGSLTLPEAGNAACFCITVPWQNVEN